VSGRLSVYLGPRGEQQAGWHQEYLLTPQRISLWQGNENGLGLPQEQPLVDSTRFTTLMEEHFGAGGCEHIAHDYDQEAWRLLGRELPPEDEVMRIVFLRQGLVLWSVEIPMGTPASPQHAAVQESGRRLWEELQGLHLSASYGGVPFIFGDGGSIEVWPSLQPEPSGDALGCPGPISFKPIIPEVLVEWPDPFPPTPLLPTLIED